MMTLQMKLGRRREVWDPGSLQSQWKGRIFTYFVTIIINVNVILKKLFWR